MKFFMVLALVIAAQSMDVQAYDPKKTEYYHPEYENHYASIQGTFNCEVSDTTVVGFDGNQFKKTDSGWPLESKDVIKIEYMLVLVDDKDSDLHVTVYNLTKDLTLMEWSEAELKDRKNRSKIHILRLDGDRVSESMKKYRESDVQIVTSGYLSSEEGKFNHHPSPIYLTEDRLAATYLSPSVSSLSISKTQKKGRWRGIFTWMNHAALPVANFSAATLSCIAKHDTLKPVVEEMSNRSKE